MISTFIALAGCVVLTLAWVWQMDATEPRRQAVLRAKRGGTVTISPAPIALRREVAIPTSWRRLRRVEAPTVTTGHEGEN